MPLLYGTFVKQYPINILNDPILQVNEWFGSLPVSDRSFPWHGQIAMSVNQAATLPGSPILQDLPAPQVLHDLSSTPSFYM